MTKLNKTEFSDKKLILAVKKLDSESLNILIDRYGKIYDSIVNKFNFSKDYIKKDMMDDKASFFFEIVKSYNPNKNTKFSTYLYNMTKWKCLDKMKLDKRMNENSSVELKSELLEISKQADSFDLSKTSDIIDKIKTFDKRTQYIFQKRFFDETKKESFSKIGKKLNLTYEGVRQIYIKHLKILKKNL